jgi:F-type H+-transporting ATPase subunit b
MAGEPHGADAAAHGADHASAVFPPFDFSLFPHQIFWFAVTFGALYFFLSSQALPTIAGVLEKRRATVQGDLDGAAAKSAAAEEARAGAERAVAAARAKARQTIESMRAETQAALAGDQAKAEAALGEKAAAAEAQINAMRAAALGEVGALSGDLAQLIVTKVTGGVDLKDARP